MTTRRDFLKTATAATLTTALNVPLVHAAGDDVLKVGLIGCGGRGTGAAEQALKADKNVKLVAMGDAFGDRLEKSLKVMQADSEIAAKIEVPPENRFVGFDAYKSVIAASDVVLLCEPPHFRPSHLQAAVAAGKHVFAEKPVAVDGPGVRSVLATCEEAKKKNLSIVSGLCLRYSNQFREMMKRIHGGAIGEVVTLTASDYRGGRWAKPRQPEWSDMTYQMRNWYNFTWLSGDFNVEQHVHFLDVASWAMKDEYPVKAVGMGGRQVLTGVEYGNIYDHFSIAYEYANGSKLFSNTRQQARCKNDMSAGAHGSKGRAFISESGMRITGENAWELKGKDNNFYQTEHDELFASIRAGKPINNGEYMSKSSLLAIMGRMAAYTGQEITWKQALDSKEDLSPAKYDWDLKLPDPPIAIPGQTKFI
jgi:myo-inositol 2-dehydrogenase / D-chiro-inositol 1-dehydrogenase